MRSAEVHLRISLLNPWVLGFCLALFCLIGKLQIVAAAQSSEKDQRPEYEVKAAFLYKFTHFTQWPTNAFKSKTSPFIIGVLGDDPFGRELDKIAETETVGIRKITIARVEKGGFPPECHILFVCNSERRRVEELLEITRGKPILTVSEIEPFCSKGGGIRFAQENKKIKLRMNADAIKQSGLRVRSELLAIARIVKSGEQ